MRDYNRLFYIFLLLLQFACNSKSEIKEFEFTPILKTKAELARNSVAPIKLALCDEIPFQWNSIFILKPYSGVEVLRKQKFINGKGMEKVFPDLTINEGDCVLLFIENNTIVRYSYVPRLLIDFNSVKYDNKILDKLSKKISCEDLYLKKYENSFTLSN